MRATKIDVSFSIYVPTKIYNIFIYLVLLYRKLHYGYAFRRIPLTRGKYAIVDPEDYEWLMKYKWHASDGRGGNFYAVNRKMQKMHRLIMNAPKGKVVDHINRNGLDNRKANLRPATHTQNMWNNGQRVERFSSKYRGVSWHKRLKRWAAIISINGKPKTIGYFKDEVKAAKAFDKVAKELRGEFAVLNFTE